MCELKIKKIKKMIRKVISGKIELPIEAFKDLCKVYENLLMVKETFIETDIVEIKPIKIESLNKPKQIKPIIQIQTIIQIEMKNVISELETNKMFLERKLLCELI
ncbi:MAG: hypothetical protein KGD57_10000 [Candidatus Lokiarchaeota archaeon]|nr:hypothetical protein [Candidatus Lokiarchaeota archaeon]